MGTTVDIEVKYKELVNILKSRFECSVGWQKDSKNYKKKIVEYRHYVLSIFVSEMFVKGGTNKNYLLKYVRFKW